MATPDPLVEEILSTLDASRPAGGALTVRAAIQVLPQRSRRTVDGRIQGVNEQLEVLQDLLLGPLKRELLALEALPRLAEFILPAGTRAASLAHVCRTVARRAERAVVALGATADLNDALRQYLNRLSDLLFVLARVLNRMDGGDDVYWKSERMARAAAADATDANDEEGSPS